LPDSDQLWIKVAVTPTRKSVVRGALASGAISAVQGKTSITVARRPDRPPIYAFGLSHPDYLYFRDHARSFESLAAHYPTSPLHVSRADGGFEVLGSVVTASYFEAPPASVARPLLHHRRRSRARPECGGCSRPRSLAAQVWLSFARRVEPRFPDLLR
jgi:hypothetical protein